MRATAFRRRALGALLLTIGMTAAACGSTVPNSERQRLASGGATGGLDGTGDAMSPDDGGDSRAADGGSAAGGAGAAGSGPAAGGASGSSGAGAGGRSTTSTTRGSKTSSKAGWGGGVSDTELRVGFEFTETLGNVHQSAGGDAGSGGDQKRMWEVLVEDLNARGGINGRKVVPLLHSTDISNSASVAEQAACAAFTEDNEVFAVLAFQHGDTFHQCIESRGVPYVGNGGMTRADKVVYERFPHYVEGGSLSLEREAVVYVEQLAAMGYFEPGAKYGLVTFDDPPFVRVSDRVLKPALQAKGVTVDEVRLPPWRGSSQDLGPISTQAGNAVLRFRTGGVTHVLILDTSGIGTFTFANAAEGQSYRPRYGMNSQMGGQIVADRIPAGHFKNAVGIGWLPEADVRAPDVPAPAPATSCLSLLRSKNVSMSDRNAEGIATSFCAQFTAFEAAARAAGRDLDGNSFMAGVEKVGRIGLANTFAGSYGPGGRDGAAAVRRIAFVDACNCFRYTGGLVEVAR